MAPLSQLAIFASLAFFTLAAPAINQDRTLSKRSFQAKAPGRSRISGAEDVARTKRKYSNFWEIIIFGSGSDLFSSSSSLPSSTSTPAPFPYTTAISSSVSSGLPSQTNSTSTVSASAPSSTAGSEDGSVAAIPEDANERSYLSPVTIGGQEFNLDFDTGSADLWVYGVDAVSSQRTAFDPNKSSTWQRISGATWQIQYGDGSGAEGYVGTDVVDVGGSTVQKQAVEVAESVSASFARDPETDGLLGLAFSSINSVEPNPQLTFFDNVKSRLTSPLFTADLEESTGKGTYDFGTIDSSKYTGAIHYTPVDSSRGFWEITTPSLLIGEESLDCTNCSPAIVDTGTSLIYLDEDVVDSYYAQVPSAAFDADSYIWTYPCSQKDNLPDLSISIGDWYAHLNGSDMNYGPLETNSDVTCVGGLQNTTQPGLAILGDVFLKQFFVVFDGDNLQVGVANKDR